LQRAEKYVNVGNKDTAQLFRFSRENMFVQSR